jgi:Ca2+-transporting ATPase
LPTTRYASTYRTLRGSEKALDLKLKAIENLGSMDTLCTDKTGTLTQDQMTVRQIYANGKLMDVSGVGYEPKGEFHIEGLKAEGLDVPAPAPVI